MIDFHLIRENVEDLLHDFQFAQAKNHGASIANVRAIRWIPPISPHCKINFDGAVFNELGAAGLGVVISDCSGNVIENYQSKYLS